MADVRDIMDGRLKGYERFLGVLTAIGQETEPIKIRNYQKGTLTIIVSGHGGSPISLVVYGTDNKGEDLWFNIDPQDDDISISADGMYAFTYALETTWFKVKWESGGTGVVRPSVYISKTIVG